MKDVYMKKSYVGDGSAFMSAFKKICVYEIK